jgi:diaminohydroxyphosphoribosylaminopyrimidine deaminase / 5-amino-6-(5-phosphoribosylamino)uracil reductase
LSEVTAADIRWLDSAVRFGRPHLGTTAGEPATAALVVDERHGLVLGRGVTGVRGRPYAEIAALADARGMTRGRTLYITLEPNGEAGPMPSEAEILAGAELRRVVIGMLHPHAARRGRGVAALTEAGIDVAVADHTPSHELHAAYARRVAQGRPLTTLLLSISRDGMIGLRKAPRPQFLGPVAQAWLGMQRALAEAVLVGAHTATVDDPTFEGAIPGLEDRPLARIVAVGAHGIASGLRLFESSEAIALAESGAELDLPPTTEVLRVAGRNGRPDIRLAMEAIATKGLSSVLVESGARLTEALIAAEMVDIV